MAGFNYTLLNIECPRCGKQTESNISLYFGKTNLEFVPVGTQYPLHDWQQECEVKGTGYGERQLCGLDFHINAKVIAGKLTDIECDPLNLPYLPDVRVKGSIPCNRCASNDTVVERFYGKFMTETLHCQTCFHIESREIWR